MKFISRSWITRIKKVLTVAHDRKQWEAELDLPDSFSESDNEFADSSGPAQDDVETEPNTADEISLTNPNHALDTETRTDKPILEVMEFCARYTPEAGGRSCDANSSYE